MGADTPTRNGNPIIAKAPGVTRVSSWQAAERPLHYRLLTRAARQLLRNQRPSYRAATVKER